MFLFMSDDFIHPEPFKADVAIDIDDVIEKKMDMYHQHKSQMYEWLPFNQGILDQVPASDADRREWLGNKMERQNQMPLPTGKNLLNCMDQEKGSKIKYCEAFEDSGYGAKLTKENMIHYFPFLKK